MPNLRSESFGGGDQSWLANTHAIGDAITATPDLAAFTQATHYPNGYIPSGTPVDYTDPTALKPYEAPTEGEDAKLGFVLFDAPVVGGSVAPTAVLVHGIVKAANVPGDFTAPASSPGFNFIDGGAA